MSHEWLKRKYSEEESNEEEGSGQTKARRTELRSATILSSRYLDVVKRAHDKLGILYHLMEQQKPTPAGALLNLKQARDLLKEQLDKIHELIGKL